MKTTKRTPCKEYRRRHERRLRLACVKQLFVLMREQEES